MKLYIFRCRTRPKMYGATRFETASNLPADRCSGVWEFYELLELTQRTTLRFAVDPDILRRQVQRNGWYVWDESPRTLGAEPPPREKERPVAVREKAALKVRPLTDMEVTPTAPATADQFGMRAHELKPALAPRQTPMEPPPVAEVTRNVVPPQVQHQVVWFDIPVRDLDRAIRFYSAVLGIDLKKKQAGPGIAMAELPHGEGSIGGCLVQNMDARPSETGPLLYLNTQGRLDEALKAVERYGGVVLSARQSIAPFGFRAIVLDSEGNRVALHSM